ncbi:MAG: type VI secretion system Vgr family protein [Planctomycetota bacterium]
MGLFSQNGSPLKVYTQLPENTLLATHLEGWERLGDSFEFSLSLRATRGTAIRFDSLVGQTAYATIEQQGHDKRFVHGEVWKLSQEDSDATFDHYTMVLKPRLARLALTRRSRIFQNQSAIDILKTVLEPVGGANFDGIFGEPPVRTYCTQYRETDLKFFLRLCSEEGVTHFWKHSHENHTLFLTNNTTSIQPTTEIGYDPTEGESTNTPVLRSWRVSQEMNTTNTALLDTHSQLFNDKLEGSSQGPAEIKAGSHTMKPTGSLELWQEDSQSAARFFDGIKPSGENDSAALGNIHPAQNRQAKILATGAAAGAVRAQGKGNAFFLTPGCAFQLKYHPQQEGEWLVVATTLSFTVDGQFWAGEPAATRVDARLEAAPLSLAQAPWPPRLRPTVGGVQTAVVTGPQGAETFVDADGRLKVHFGFDRDGPVDANSSCWVRVAQVWAGKNYGAAFWPRVGHEVVVSFEGGDPDRPIVTGSVYNATNMPPFELPSQVYISGFKTLTQGGDSTKNYHLLLLSDAKKQEVVLIHAEGLLVTQQERKNVTFENQGSVTITEF